MNAPKVAVLENVNANGILMREAAQELGAHGHREAATALWERYLTEYVPRQAERNRRILTRTALAAMGRYAEARSELLAGAEPGPAGFSQRARATPLAVAAGDTVGAMAMVDSLQTREVEAPGEVSGLTPKTRAQLTAQILSLLGRTVEAVAMIRTALNNGYRLLRDAERKWYWAPLQDYPPFQALVRPKG